MFSRKFRARQFGDLVMGQPSFPDDLDNLVIQVTSEL